MRDDEERSNYDTAEGVRAHLASMPGLANTTTTREVVRKILLDTDGQMILAGHLYDITSKHLGAGIYRVSTKLANP